jgi:hypothetical protein
MQEVLQFVRVIIILIFEIVVDSEYGEFLCAGKVAVTSIASLGSGRNIIYGSSRMTAYGDK